MVPIGIQLHCECCKQTETVYSIHSSLTMRRIGESPCSDIHRQKNGGLERTYTMRLHNASMTNKNKTTEGDTAFVCRAVVFNSVKSESLRQIGGSELESDGK